MEHNTFNSNYLSQKFQSIYAFSTENLEYLNYLNLSHKEVVTIGGSFDQAIVSYMGGANHVTNIDINPYAQYYAELKYYALKHLSYEEFKTFLLRGEQSFSIHHLVELLQFCSENTKMFWLDSLKTTGYSRFLRESSLFDNSYDTPESKIFNSYYLRNEDLYIEAQKNLKEFIWLHKDISQHSQKTDVLLLSNLIDYTHYMYENIQDFKEHIINPWFNLLNTSGKIMTGYTYDCSSTHYRNLLGDKAYRSQYFKRDNGSYYEHYIPTALTGRTEREYTMDCVGILEKISL